MEQARHAASTKRHSRHELQNRRKRKPVFLRMMGVLLVAGAALACFGFWRFQTPGIVLGPFEDEPSTAESVPPPEPEPQPVTTTLRFSATGDNLIHAPIYKQAAPFGNSINHTPALRSSRCARAGIHFGGMT